MRKVVTVQFTVIVDFDTDGETVEISDSSIKTAASEAILSAVEASYEWESGDGIVDKITDATGWCISGISISGQDLPKETA
jgi:hypothetical protein